MKNAVAVGVDAGGTSTVAIASRDGIKIGRGHAGSANASSQGAQAAADAIALAVRGAVGSADAFSLFVGAAGAGRECVARALEVSLHAHLPHAHAVHVEEDVLIALRAVIPDGPGAMLIAGTGSIAYAENGERRSRVGGAGYLLGDEGSGFALGLAALRALLRVYDRRAQADEMTDFVRETLAVDQRDEVLATVYDAASIDVARIAGLAPGVITLAGAGNRAAGKIIQGAAKDLGDLVCAAAGQTGLTEHSPSIGLGGGLLRENNALTYLLEMRLRAELPGATIMRAQTEPVDAALRFAQAMLAQSVS